MLIYWLTASWLAPTLYFALFLATRYRNDPGDRTSRHPDWAQPRSDDSFDEELAEWSLRLRLESYLERTKQLANNLRIQTAILLVGLLSLFATAKDPLPFVGDHFSATVLHLIIPAAIIFFWLQFGHQLAAVVGLRLSVWHMLTEIEHRKAIDESSMYSRRSFLELGMFLEAWFALFVPRAYQEPVRSLAPFNVITILPYGILFVVSQSLVYSLLNLFFYRLSIAIMPAHWALLAAVCVTAGIAIFLWYVHHLFYFAARNRNWLTPLVIGLTVAGTPAFTYLGLTFSPDAPLAFVHFDTQADTAETGLLAYTDQYCEREAPGPWQEPFNTTTNAAFLIAAAVCFGRLLAVGHMSKGLITLVGLLGLIGIGSTLFHVFANRLTEWADVLPIFAYQVLFLYLYLRRGITFGRFKAALLSVAFIASNVLVFVMPSYLNGSLLYAPALLVVLLLGEHFRRTMTEYRFLLLATAGVFIISVTFRTLDAYLCNWISVGTHFLWHILNAVVLTLAFLSLLHIDITYCRGAGR